jgi:hypothetical protein
LNQRSLSSSLHLLNQSNFNHINSNLEIKILGKILNFGLLKLKMLLLMKLMKKSIVQHLMEITTQKINILLVLAKKHSFLRLNNSLLQKKSQSFSIRSEIMTIAHIIEISNLLKCLLRESFLKNQKRPQRKRKRKKNRSKREKSKLLKCLSCQCVKKFKIFSIPSWSFFKRTLHSPILKIC